MTTCKQDRSILVISGDYADCLRQAKHLTINLECLHVKDNKKANQWLGQEFDAVIFETHDTFSPNAFGALAGTIRCGGFLLILKPDVWPKESLFLQRFNAVLKITPNVRTISSEKLTPLPIPLQLEYLDSCATIDQNSAVDAIIHVVKGHRRRPLVITSDRGRGKSAALGIAAAKLFNQGVRKIAVCAPSKNTAAVIFKHAKEQAPNSELVFYSPDELQQKVPSLDLLLIDEAAAIPVPLLSFFLANYSRIVFSTTQHGYEGSGRGFAINFRKVLDELTPNWNHCQLQTPIRWGENDTLEQFVFEALLLNAEQSRSESLSGFKRSQCTFSLCDKKMLLQLPSKQLGEIFGLLINAHYQTKPSDLMQILDSETISLYTIRFNQHIVAVALLSNEGNIDEDTATQIFQGNRRLKGHLAAQSLAANVGLKHAPCLKGQRIIRIAVHPSLQRQGIGTYLLNQISDAVNTDYFSTSYGATKELLHFWKQCGFTPVYLSMKRDASSGTHSVLMLKGKNQKGEDLRKEASLRFKHDFPHLLSDPFKALESDIAISLLKENLIKFNYFKLAKSANFFHEDQCNRMTMTTHFVKNNDSFSALNSNRLNQAFLKKHQAINQLLSDLEETIVIAFANHQRGYENSLHPIWKKVCICFFSAEDLTEQEQKVILYKVLQKRPWEDTVRNLGDNIKGKKEALMLLRRAIQRLI